MSNRELSEEAIHRQVWGFFRVSLPPAVFFVHPVQEGKGGWKARAPAPGGMPGLPDWLLIYQGRTFAIELKNLRGKMSRNQLYALDKMKEAGAEVAVCRSLDDVIGQLDEWGIPMIARLSA